MSSIKNFNSIADGIVPIVGYEGRYALSKKGNIYSYLKKGTKVKRIVPVLIKQKIGTTHCGKHYKSVKLRKNNNTKDYYVHRLVAIAFLPNNENKPQVHHKDNNPENNNLLNLSWCTNSENQLHRFHGQPKGRKHNLPPYVYKSGIYYRAVIRRQSKKYDKSFKTIQECKDFLKEHLIWIRNKR